ncbi:hypothetical protein [Anaerospora sp.]|uniref:hypothetical protein n=1 Tax=Anaerospora sp. TaxID=1960278 RepID=UPI00289BBFEC|nr:hypothetical protein [Anaerospora sp.]
MNENDKQKLYQLFPYLKGNADAWIDGEGKAHDINNEDRFPNIYLKNCYKMVLKDDAGAANHFTDEESKAYVKKIFKEKLKELKKEIKKRKIKID